MWPFIVNGLVTGAVYGLAAVGLAVSYKTSGLFNFAHGAIATVAAYLFYVLYVEQELSWVLAAAITVVGVGAVIGPAMERVARSVADAGLALKVTATVGIVLIVQSAALLVFGVEEPRNVPVFLGTDLVDLGGTVVKVADIVTFVFALVATGCLYAYFRITRRGLAMRAVVDSAALLDLAGTSPVATRRWAWCIGSSFAAASGVLFATLLPLDPTLLTLLVVQAFGAAALGAFTSLPLAFAGGLTIGVLSSLSTKWFTTGLLAGLSPALPFVVLFLVLLLFPKRYLVEDTKVVPPAKSDWRFPARLQLTAGAALLVLLLLVPSFAGLRLADWTTALGTVILLLSLGQLVRESGQVSLAHVAFAAIGATMLGHLAGDGMPWLAALLIAGLVAVPVGAILAIPAIRLTGLYLALATFGFGVALSYMFYTQDYMFGNTGAPVTVPRPSGFDGDEAYYYLVLAATVVLAGITLVLTRSRLGRLLRGLAESDLALSTSGVDVRITRLIVFAFSAFVAAIAGGLIAAGRGSAQMVDYAPLLSLTYLALVVISPGRDPWYAFFAAGGLVLVPSYVGGEDVSTWTTLLFGVGAVLYAVVPVRARELPASARAAIDRWSRADRGSRAPELRQQPAQAARRPVAETLTGALEVRDLQVSFGGVAAVDGLSLTVPTGRIIALIGPNGAGKTTTFNACSGLVAPRAGQVLLNGRDVTRMGPAARALSGLGRTFQRMELFETLTVHENVLAGAEGELAGRRPVRHVITFPGERAATEAAVEAALDACGIAHLADRPASALSTGERRLVELARCLAGSHQLLLLDEPSSGLDRHETEQFGEILQRVVAERGIGVLLVEHDMSLVLNVSDHIYVLDFGRPIFDGDPEATRASPIVQAAYLGDAFDVPAPSTAAEGA